MTPRDPQTPDEWRSAVNAARWAILVDSARQHGLITTNLVVDVDRCLALLERGAAAGYTPAPDAELLRP